MEILDQFGIEPKLLLVQLINFGILALVLWKWVLPRLTNLMEQRQRSIKDSLEAAEQARADVAVAEAKRDEELKESRDQALAIIGEAKDQAKVEGERVIAAAKSEAEGIVTRTERQLAAERDKLRSELRAELAGMTIEATRQVLARVTNAQDSDTLLQKAIKDVQKERSASRR